MPRQLNAHLKAVDTYVCYLYINITIFVLQLKITENEKKLPFGSFYCNGRSVGIAVGAAPCAPN